jgi:predicted porin
VSLGRIATPYYDVEGAQDAVFNSALSPEANIFRTSTAGSLGTATVRSNNTLRYDMPAIGGFGASVSYSLDEKAGVTSTAATATAADFNTVNAAAIAAGTVVATTGPKVGLAAAGVATTSLNLTYAGGPVAVSFAYQNDAKYQGNTWAATYADQNFTRLQGSYDFGGIVAKAGYGKAGNVANVSGADTTEYMLGLDYKASSALTLSVGYANSKDNSTLSANPAGDVERKGYGLGAAYTLSKRTFLYGGYEADTETKPGNPFDVKHSVLAAGVQHRF